jgi:hypothetical protein
MTTRHTPRADPAAVALEDATSREPAELDATRRREYATAAEA